ncbi:HD domain-containing protein [Candidatus Micrarchaeota archaeon]|nr:HD domain-containing protein [Candidatus Micrarchaeota archaeon]
MTVIRDAIHGGIEVNDLEKKIVDHPLFQRLHGVRQLSVAHLVYPSALHTRFEHSLGSMHLTGTLAERLNLSEEEIQLVRVAALLHDVGHGAFSHTSDELLEERTGKTHEMRGLDLVQQTTLTDTLEENGIRISDLKNRFEGVGAGALITHELGTDRMDYLLRDAYFTGVGYSSVDHQRLLETMALKDGRLYIQEKGVVAAESLLVSRHLMFNAVYLHPTVRIASAMAQAMLASALSEGQASLNDVAQGTDESLLNQLAPKNAWSQRLKERRLLKKAVVQATADMGEETQAFLGQKNAEEKMTDALHDAGIKECVICLPPKRKKHEGIQVKTEAGDVEPLEKHSALLKALNVPSSRDTLIVAVDEKNKEKAAQTIQQLLKG